MSPFLPLMSREILGNRPGPRVLITGGVHGDEFEPMATIRRLMQSLNPESLRGSVTLIPVVNAAAFRLGTRTAEDGLDLARVCPGDPNGSVTEQIAHALSEQIHRADYYIDLHTGGKLFSVLPLAGYSIHPDPKILDVQRRMARVFNLQVVWGTSPLPGRSLSVAFDAGIPAIYAEYLGGATCHPDGVDAYTEGCLNVLHELGMIDRKTPPSQVKMTIEDNRPSSGHLQIQNLAPIDGYFSPALRIGDRVQPGDPLGTVTDPLGERVKTVRSEQHGILLVSRIFPLICQGESTGVVLELPPE